MTAKGDVLPEKLPPPARAAYYHSLRVHLHVVTQESVGEINLDTLEWGWKINENSLVLIISDLDPAPSHLLQFIRCKSKTENRRCSTSICSCRRHRLKRVSSCATCRGKSYENSDVRDLIFISHFYKSSKRSERTISLYGFRTTAPQP